MTLTETWTSTDGASHRLLLKPEVDLASEISAIDLPWTGAGFQQYVNRPTLEVPAGAPGSLFVVTDTDSSNTDRSFGALSFSVAPQSIRFWDNSPEYPELVYPETVGPDQPFSFRWVFNASQSEQAVRDAAARAEESLKPAPPASSPPPAPPAPEPVRCRVPRLRKHLLRIAVGRIERANCRVGTVRKVYRKHRVTRRRHGKKVRVRVPYRRGTVLAQRPRPGTLLPDDSKVDMVVQGRRPHRHRRRRRH